jgi:hypothetical protein
MPTRNQHLRRRGAVYHYRRRLPAALKEILNATHFDGSLETADPARARKLAREMSVALDQLAERLQRMPPALKPTAGQLNLVLKDLFDSILRDGDLKRDLTNVTLRGGWAEVQLGALLYQMLTVARIRHLIERGLKVKVPNRSRILHPRLRGPFISKLDSDAVCL